MVSDVKSADRLRNCLPDHILKGTNVMFDLQQQLEITTIEQYRALPNHASAEVFDGRVCYMASHSRTHRAILSELTSRLSAYVMQKNGDCEVIPAPFDVKLSSVPFTLVHPDIMIVCNRHKLVGTWCSGAPDFIAEIVSPGYPADDYVRKLYYYQNHGVREYWIVDPKRRSVFVNYFEENLFSVPYTFDSIIKVNIYEDLYINFSNIATLLNL